MTLICLASQKGSPGTTMTTLAVAAALQVSEGRQKVMVEADCTGGTLAIRYQLPVEPGLLTLAAAVRGGVDADSLWRHTQELPGGLRVVVCPDGPDQVHAAMSASGAALGRFLNQLGNVDVICDVGRLAPDSAALSFVAEASALLMVARPSAEQLQPAARRMMALRPQVDNIGWILVGEKPYGPTEIEATYKFPVVGVVADDPRAVARLEQGLMTKRLRRSPFVRSSATLATTLSSWLGPLQSTEAGIEQDEPAPVVATRGGISPRQAPVPAPPEIDVESPPSPPNSETTDGSIPLTGVPMPSAPVADPPNPNRDLAAAAPAAPPPPSPSTAPTQPPGPPGEPETADSRDWPAPTPHPPTVPPPAPDPTPHPPSPTPVSAPDPASIPTVPPAPEANGHSQPGPPLPPLPPSDDAAAVNGAGVESNGKDPAAAPAPAVNLTRLPPPPDGLQPLDPTPPSALTNGSPVEPVNGVDPVAGHPPWPYGSPTEPDRSAEPPPQTQAAAPSANGDGWDTEIFTRTIDFEELLAPAAPAADMPPVASVATDAEQETPSAVDGEPERAERPGRSVPPSPFPHEDLSFDDWGRG